MASTEPQAAAPVDAAVRKNAIKILAARAVSSRALAENIPSPCVSICRMDASSDLCEGCFRTIDEIRVWSLSNDAAKRRMWAALTERLRQAHPNAFATESLS